MKKIQSDWKKIEDRKGEFQKKMGLWGLLRILSFSYDAVRANPIWNYLRNVPATVTEDEENGHIRQPLYYIHQEFLSNMFVLQIQLYSLLIMILLVFVLMMSMSGFSVFVLFLSRALPEMSPYSWNARFRIVTILWLVLPSVVVKTVEISIILGKLKFRPLFAKSAV